MKKLKLNLNRLEELRNHYGLSMRAFSVKIGLDVSHYEKLLKSTGEQVTIKTINKMAAALGRKPRELLRED